MTESIQIILDSVHAFQGCIEILIINELRPAQLIPTIATMSRHNAASNVHYPMGVGRHNISILMYVPLIALNTSVDLTAIVYSNHEPMNQSYTVNTRCALVGRPLCAAHPALSAPI